LGLLLKVSKPHECVVLGKLRHTASMHTIEGTLFMDAQCLDKAIIVVCKNVVGSIIVSPNS
jgi:hypothetical protein